MSFRFDCLDVNERERGVSRAAVSVSEGLLVVLPTDSAYGVGTDAFSRSGIDLLGRARNRWQAPPVLVAHARTLDGVGTDVNSGIRDLVDAFWPGGLTVLVRQQPTLTWDLGDDNGTVALRMPLHPVALQLLEKTGPLAVTSANRPDSEYSAVPLTYDAAWAALSTAVDVYLDAGPMTRTAVSTVVDGTDPNRPPRVLRLGAIGIAALRAVVPDLDTGAVEPVADRPVDERPADGKRVDEKRADEKPADAQPGDEQPGGSEAAG